MSGPLATQNDSRSDLFFYYQHLCFFHAFYSRIRYGAVLMNPSSKNYNCIILHFLNCTPEPGIVELQEYCRLTFKGL